MLPLPVQTYLMILVGLVTRDQEQVIEYLQSENKVLRELLNNALGGRRIRLTERQRRRLAEFGRKLGWRRLPKYCGVVTPRTIYAWHRRLIAKKHDSSKQRKGKPMGRPPKGDETRKLVIRLALENNGLDPDQRRRQIAGTRGRKDHGRRHPRVPRRGGPARWPMV